MFSRLYVNMVKAAETGGILDKILDRLAAFLESEQEIRAKIKGAMIYPILVLIVRGGDGDGADAVRSAEVQGDIRLR